MYVLSLREHFKLRSIYKLCSRMRLNLLAIENLTFEGRAFLDSLTKTMAKLKEFLPGELPEQNASEDFDDDLIRLYKKLEKFRLKLNTFYLERRRLSDALGELQRLLYAFLLK